MRLQYYANEDIIRVKYRNPCAVDTWPGTGSVAVVAVQFMIGFPVTMYCLSMTRSPEAPESCYTMNSKLQVSHLHDVILLLPSLALVVPAIIPSHQVVDLSSGALVL